VIFIESPKYGIMEYWNDGRMSISRKSKIYFSNPVFQDSIIPLFLLGT
jgi:hypothetical protein